MYDVRDDDSEEEELGPSRGRVRREQRAQDASLAKLASRIVEMSVHARRKLPLDDALRREVELAAGIIPGTGLRRQLRRLTLLLREDEALTRALQLALDPPPSSANAPPDTPAGRWLEQLVRDGDTALQQLVDAHPDTDRPRVRQWIRSVTQAREKAARIVAEGGLTPPKDKSERTLKKYLTELLATAPQ